MEHPVPKVGESLGKSPKEIPSEKRSTHYLSPWLKHALARTGICQLARLWRGSRHKDYFMTKLRL